MPMPMDRRSAGNHSFTALAAAGQFPGSVSPNPNRQAARLHLPTANPCIICASDHPVTKKAKPRLVPSRSTMYPDPAYMMA